jgi:hypothetical protein
MALILDGNGLIQGLDAGGLPSGSVNADTLASTLDLSSKTMTFGNVSASGITFPASISASSNANTLDDYEEGTFTVTTAGDATGAFTGQIGEYTKIGNICYVRIAFSVSSGFATNAIGGLPFTAGGSGSPSGVSAVNVVQTASSSGSPIIMQNSIGDTNVYFYSGTTTANAHNPNTTNSVYRLNFFYRVA